MLTEAGARRNNVKCNKFVNLLPGSNSPNPVLFTSIRKLLVKATARSQVLEAPAKAETSCVAQSVVTYAHMWRPLCVSCSRAFGGSVD